MVADVKEFQRILLCAQHRHRQGLRLAAFDNTAALLGITESVLIKLASSAYPQSANSYQKQSNSERFSAVHRAGHHPS
jgi:hypothetical protein